MAKKESPMFQSRNQSRFLADYDRRLSAEGEEEEVGGSEAAPADEPARPAWLPEKFETPEALVESYGSLETKMKTSRTEIEAEIKQKLADGGDRPESPEKYELRVPEGTDVPKGVNVEFDEKNPMLMWWKDFAFESGLGQEGFDKGIQAWINGEVSGLPDVDAIASQLGERGKERIAAVDTWGSANLSPDAYAAMQDVGDRAGSVVLMEEIMDKLKDGRHGGGGGEGGAVYTIEELQQMQKDPRYHDSQKREPAFVRKVTSGFEALHKGTRRLG